jgi:hypothetical protein
MIRTPAALRGRLRGNLQACEVDAASARRATHYEAASRSRDAAYSLPVRDLVHRARRERRSDHGDRGRQAAHAMRG